jgi:hypothetical protein
MTDLEIENFKISIIRPSLEVKIMVGLIEKKIAQGTHIVAVADKPGSGFSVIFSGDEPECSGAVGGAGALPCSSSKDRKRPSDRPIT